MKPERILRSVFQFQALQLNCEIVTEPGKLRKKLQVELQHCMLSCFAEQLGNFRSNTRLSKPDFKPNSQFNRAMAFQPYPAADLPEQDDYHTHAMLTDFFAGFMVIHNIAVHDSTYIGGMNVHNGLEFAHVLSYLYHLSNVYISKGLDRPFSYPSLKKVPLHIAELELPPLFRARQHWSFSAMFVRQAAMKRIQGAWLLGNHLKMNCDDFHSQKWRPPTAVLDVASSSINRWYRHLILRKVLSYRLVELLKLKTTILSDDVIRYLCCFL